jgi:hypothetical protein
VRIARLWCGGLSLALVLSATALAQHGAATGQPASESAVPLAKFVPKDNLVLYVESAGLDAHDDAWKKTSAYKMLNDARLGGMFEEFGAQTLDWLLRHTLARKVKGEELVSLFEFTMHHGFVVGVNADAKAPRPYRITIVLRNWRSNDIKAVAGRFLGWMMRDFKPSPVNKGGRTIVPVTAPSGAKWAWWVEGDDVVLCMAHSDDAEAVIECLDGKRASAVDHPSRTPKAHSEIEFEPLMTAFVDAAGFPEIAKDSAAEKMNQLAKVWGVGRIEAQWGFSEKAMTTITRVFPTEQRKGIFLVFNKKTFDKTALPAMPDRIDGFTVASIDAAETFKLFTEELEKAAPESAKSLTKWVDSLQSNTGLKLQKDVLAQLGPRFAFYVDQSKKQGLAAATMKAAMAGDPMSILAAAIPKIVLFIEVRDPKNFGKTFDQVMQGINKSLQAMVNSAINNAVANANAEAQQKGQNVRFGRKADVPAIKFKMIKDRIYVLEFPEEMGKLPQGLRPCIRFESNYLVFTINPADAADIVKVLETKSKQLKETAWLPAGDLAEIVSKVPSKLVYVGVDDPRDTLPAQLASIPGRFQAALNAGLTSRQGGGGGGGAPGPGMPGPGMMGPGRGGMPGPGGAGMPGPGGAGMPGPGGGGGQASSPGLHIEIDPAKMPNPDALKSKMFPSSTSISSDDEGMTIVTREAFPPVGDINVFTLLVAAPYINKALKALGIEFRIIKVLGQDIPGGEDVTGGSQAGGAPAAGGPGAGAPGPGGAAGGRGGRGGGPGRGPGAPGAPR